MTMENHHAMTRDEFDELVRDVRIGLELAMDLIDGADVRAGGRLLCYADHERALWLMTRAHDVVRKLEGANFELVGAE